MARIKVWNGTTWDYVGNDIANVVTTSGSQTLTNKTIDGSQLVDGSVTMPKIANPYKFSVLKTTAQSAGVILWNSENFDTNNDYDPATGRYTASVAGYYQFNAHANASVTAAPQDPDMRIRKNGVQVGYSHFVNMYNGTSAGSGSCGVLIYLGIGDYVDVYTGRALTISTGASGFSGYLVSET